MANKRGKIMNELNPLYGKVIISGQMTCVTGLHIGAASGTQQIGGIDAPVVKDPVTGEPYIPGSSLKGKLRSLLERSEMKRHMEKGLKENYLITVAGKKPKEVRLHVCSKKECPVCGLFGSTPMTNEGVNMPSPLIVSDLRLIDPAKLQDKLNSPLMFTEWKAENTLDRITAHSNPRDIERVPRDAHFALDIIYNVSDPGSLTRDIENLVAMLLLLQDDYLGGSGSRGYGRVNFIITNIIARKIEYYAGKEKAVKCFSYAAGADEKQDAEKRRKGLEGVQAEIVKDLPEIVGFFRGKS